MRVLSLCSGIGGLELGVKRVYPEAEVVLYVEADRYCQRVLHARMADGGLDAAPLHGDLCAFDGRPWRGCVDLITAGFPCQDISNAGRREGIKEGNRSGLFFEVMRVLGEVGPRFVFLENVAALLNRGLDLVLGSLAEAGYDAEWGLFSAADVGAPHLRKRIFILAGAGGERLEGDREAGAATGAVRRGSRTAVDDPAGQRLHGNDRRQDEPLAADGLPRFPPGPADATGWERYLARFPEAQCCVRGGPSGLPHRVDRLRALGNAVVPAQAALALTVLMERLSE